MRLLNATSVTLFNNLNQAICVGTHSIEHQKQFLISMSDEVTKATFKLQQLIQQFIEPLFEATKLKLKSLIMAQIERWRQA
ncbi:hypothetical protein [Aeromonas caviae]|uniref:hypothetical protein n=1 Tax=Aeromonas caviae TaxID=648 RepID=UPI001CC59055|nr:hypothetical protein [Aeromonas caviae]GJB51277.1 hypothetical protein KAM372_27380 [Aeromonas caviae]GKQ85802.1 hypothetical protein KAM449_35490 [Aeromonas caviae]